MLDELTACGDAAPPSVNLPACTLQGLLVARAMRMRFAFCRGACMARVEVRSEITGTVWQIKASVGDQVEAGDTLVVIESMKMEIPVITEERGVVKEILVKEKEAVAEGQVVAILEN
jgi:acetyl-CoA carboxylase biotin carboxyl carrier protein